MLQTKSFFIHVFLSILLLALSPQISVADQHETHCTYIQEDDNALACNNLEEIGYETGIENCENNHADDDTDIFIFSENEQIDESNITGNEKYDYGISDLNSACQLDYGVCCNSVDQGFTTNESCNGDFIAYDDLEGQTPEEACGIQDEETVILSGQVQVDTDDGLQPAQGADIIISNGNTYSTNTNADGQYQIEIQPGEYTVDASYDGQGECTVRKSTSAQSDTTLNFDLEGCTESGDSGDIDDPTQDFVCNESVEPTDQYVCNPFTDTYYQEDLSCEDFGYDQGGLKCDSDSCQVDTSDCFYCPDDEMNCNTERQCSQCQTCQDSPRCSDQCSTDFSMDDITFLLEPVSESTVTLSVALDNSICNGIKDYTIESCVPEYEDGEEVCQGGATIVEDQTLTQSGDEWQDSPANTNRICYTLLVDGQEKQKCINEPSGFCEGKTDGEYCDVNDKVVCQNGQEIQRNPDCENCLETIEEGQPTARCLSTNYKDLCTQCSGPFGLHSDSEVNLGDQTWELGDDRTVSSCALNTDQGIASICYADSHSESQTAVGEFHSCSDITSCSDYRSRNSCVDDACRKQLDCEWNSLGEDLGVGVCAPEPGSENPTYDCEQCGDDDVECTEDSCQAYGDKCEYIHSEKVRDSTDVACLSPENHICEMYKDRESCLGGNSFNLDVSYADNTRVGITNSIIASSNDTRNLGKCVWTEEDGGTCKRNADGNLPGDQLSPQSENALDKMSDFQSPTTSITSIRANEQYDTTILEDFTMQKRDNTYDSSNIYTRFSLKKRGESLSCEDTVVSVDGETYCYPTQTRTDLIQTDLQAGRYTLYYYSRDTSRNLETVQSKSFEIIPELNISVTPEVSYDSSDQLNTFIGNAEITIQQEQSRTYPMSCDVDVFQNNIDGSQTQVASFNLAGEGTISGEATALEDGKQHSYTVDCTAEGDNWAYNDTAEGSFTVDSSNVLIEQTPRLEDQAVYAPDDTVQLSFETSQPATCYITTETYDESYVGFGDNIPSVSWKTVGTDTTEHTYELNIQNEFDNPIGVKHIYPRCDNLQKFGETTNFVGGTAHAFTFGIDDLPPTATVIDINEDQEYNVSNPQETLNLRMNVTDNPTNKYAGTYLNFGIQNIQYCVGNQTCTYQYTYSPNGDSRFQQNLENTIEGGESSRQYLKIQANDTNGNTNEILQPLTLRNTDYLTDPLIKVEGD